MRITKGLITAAGDRHRRLPLQTLVDHDGATRTVLAMLVNEVLGAGIEEIAIVIPPGEQDAYSEAVSECKGKLHFVPQEGPKGYASAIWCARDYLENEPCLHLVGDHVYIRSQPTGWAQRLVDVAEAQECSVSAVQPTHESSIGRFGVIGGAPLAGDHGLYKIDAVVEKPTPTQAEQQLIVSGLRAGFYLAFFGMHVLTPSLLGLLEEQTRSDSGKASVSAALHSLASRERYLALQVSTNRYDLGPRYGLLYAQLALALSGEDRDEVLSTLLALVATHDGNDRGNGRV